PREDRDRLGPAPILELPGPLPDAMHAFRVIREFSPACFGKPVDAPSALHLRLHHAFVFELLQGRIHAARARPVPAARAFAHLLHELVAMLRSVSEQRKDRQTDLAGFEKSLAAERKAASPGKSPGKAFEEEFLHLDISDDISKSVSAQVPGPAS